MSSNRIAPGCDIPPAPDQLELATNEGEELDDDILRNARWLSGFRVDSIHGPRASAYQVASYRDGAVPFVENVNEISTEIIVTNTKRNANYVHRGWSLDAASTVSPWTSSRIAATNQPNDTGTWYTRSIKTKRVKLEVLLEDLAPVQEFEAAMEEALRWSTTFEKFQAIYRVLGRW